MSNWPRPCVRCGEPVVLTRSGIARPRTCGYSHGRLDEAEHTRWKQAGARGRIINVVFRNGITLEDALGLPDRVLLKLRNLGPGSLRELRTFLSQLPEEGLEEIAPWHLPGHAVIDPLLVTVDLGAEFVRMFAAPPELTSAGGRLP